VVRQFGAIGVSNFSVAQIDSTRRRVLLASLLSVLPLGLSGGRAEAINSSERFVRVTG
jgi:hypothetical protein